MSCCHRAECAGGTRIVSACHPGTDAFRGIVKQFVPERSDQVQGSAAENRVTNQVAYTVDYSGRQKSTNVFDTGTGVLSFVPGALI